MLWEKCLSFPKTSPLSLSLFFLHPLTECIHRITEQLRLEETPGDHLVQSPCLDQGQLKQTAQGCIQSGFNHPQGWRQQLVPVFDCSCSEKFLLIFKWKLLYFRSGTLPLALSPFYEVFIYISEIHPEHPLLWTEQIPLPQPRLIWQTS